MRNSRILLRLYELHTPDAVVAAHFYDPVLGWATCNGAFRNQSTRWFAAKTRRSGESRPASGKPPPILARNFSSQKVRTKLPGL